ncbi:MAG: GMP synthase subunit A [Candidatus Thermoplasmatota archaeon]
MARIFVVDNGGQWTHREWRVLKYLDVDTEIVPNTTPWEKLADLDGLMLSGGAPRVGLEHTLGACGDYLKNAPYPILGICAGEQLMATHYGGKVAPGKVPEFGKTELILDDVKGGTILAGLPEKSIVWESHNDEVVTVPPRFNLVAHSLNCPVQTIEHESLPRYGLQFHPEVEHTQFGERIFRNFIDACRK